MRQLQKEIPRQPRISKKSKNVTRTPKTQVAIAEPPLVARETKREKTFLANAIGTHCLAETRLTVFFTKSETKTDRAHHLSKITDR